MKNIHREFAPHFQKWAATMVIIGHYELVSGVVKMVVGNGEGLNLSLRGIRTSALVGNLMSHLYTHVGQLLGFRVILEIILGFLVTNPISNTHCIPRDYVYHHACCYKINVMFLKYFKCNRSWRAGLTPPKLEGIKGLRNMDVIKLTWKISIIFIFSKNFQIYPSPRKYWITLDVNMSKCRWH